MDSISPHPAIDRPDKCGVTEIINGREWVCVKAVHAEAPRPGHGHRSQQWSPGYTRNGVPTYPPRSIQHYFMRRWPNSDH